MRPVDADIIDKQIREWIGQPGYGDYWSGYDNALCAIQDFIADTPTLTPQSEPLTCEGCIHEHNEHENCNYCKRASYLGDYYYCRPPEGE